MSPRLYRENAYQYSNANYDSLLVMMEESLLD